MARRARYVGYRDDFDGAWKNMLTEKRFASFVAFFMPDVYDLIDWTREVEFKEQELRAITRKTRRGHRSVDRLVKVWLRDGSETWILVHVEIQSQEDVTLPYRMMQCRYRVLDQYGERAIECLAILGDPNASWRPNSYSIGFWKTRLQFDFRTVKLLDYSDRLGQLVASSNPFARFVAAHLLTIQTRNDLETRMEWKLRVIQGLYDMALSEDEIGQLCHDFDWLLGLPEPLAERYYNRMVQFEEEREVPHLSTPERIGRKRGRQEGQRDLLEDQLAEKFGTLPDTARMKLHKFSQAQLKRLGRAILTAKSLEELGLGN